MKKKILLFLLVLFLLLVAAGCGTTDSKVQSTLDAASAKQLEAKRPVKEEPYYEHDVSIGYIYEEENPVTYALTEKEMLEIYDAYLQSREENVWFDGLIDCATICDIVISDHEGSRIFRYIGEYLEEYGQNRCLCLTKAAQSAICHEESFC
ncbi:MAG: hypothetical protein MJ075_02655 [Oscillospiraceae bacterium]|nr:hypothetical protein [Oscillospiraceae bacterium]